MNNVGSTQTFGRVAAVLLGTLITGIVIRVVGPRLSDWSDSTTWALIAAMGIVAVSFTSAALIEKFIGNQTQPVSSVLASIGIRTGGVAAAALVGAVLYPAWKETFLIALGAVYLVALLIDTVVWARGQKARSFNFVTPKIDPSVSDESTSEHQM